MGSLSRVTSKTTGSPSVASAGVTSRMDDTFASSSRIVPSAFQRSLCSGGASADGSLRISLTFSVTSPSGLPSSSSVTTDTCTETRASSWPEGQLEPSVHRPARCSPGLEGVEGSPKCSPAVDPGSSTVETRTVNGSAISATGAPPTSTPTRTSKFRVPPSVTCGGAADDLKERPRVVVFDHAGCADAVVVEFDAGRVRSGELQHQLLGALKEVVVDQRQVYLRLVLSR